MVTAWPGSGREEREDEKESRELFHTRDKRSSTRRARLPIGFVAFRERSRAFYWLDIGDAR